MARRGRDDGRARVASGDLAIVGVGPARASRWSGAETAAGEGWRARSGRSARLLTHRMRQRRRIQVVYNASCAYLHSAMSLRCAQGLLFRGRRRMVGWRVLGWDRCRSPPTPSVRRARTWTYGSATRTVPSGHFGTGFRVACVSFPQEVVP